MRCVIEYECTQNKAAGKNLDVYAEKFNVIKIFCARYYISRTPIGARNIIEGQSIT